MYRLIYCLELELHDPAKPGALIHLIAWLRPDGSSQYITPDPPKKRTVDLRPGDSFTHSGGRFQMKAVRSYREHLVTADELGRDLQAREGCVVKGRV